MILGDFDGRLLFDYMFRLGIHCDSLERESERKRRHGVMMSTFCRELGKLAQLVDSLIS